MYASLPAFSPAGCLPGCIFLPTPLREGQVYVQWGSLRSMQSGFALVGGGMNNTDSSNEPTKVQKFVLFDLYVIAQNSVKNGHLSNMLIIASRIVLDFSLPSRNLLTSKMVIMRNIGGSILSLVELAGRPLVLRSPLREPDCLPFWLIIKVVQDLRAITGLDLEEMLLPLQL